MSVLGRSLSLRRESSHAAEIVASVKTESRRSLPRRGSATKQALAEKVTPEPEDGQVELMMVQSSNATGEPTLACNQTS